MATQAQLAAVQQLYVGYLGRAADSAGQQFWANAIANGTATIASVATGFTLSAEYKAAYGGLTTDALVEKVYNNVLGRTPDAEGKAFWVAALASGKVTADTLVATIVTNLGALDQQTINNKVFVAQTYTDTVGDAYTPAGGAAVLVGVDSTPASVITAIASINAGTLPGQVPGLALINTLDAAQTSVVNFETSNKAAVDALAATLKLTVAAGTDFDTELGNVVTAAGTARSTASTEKDTSVLVARAATAKTAADDAYAALSTTEKAQADKYVAAIAAEATAKTGAATATEQGSVIGGLAADATAVAGFTAHNNGTAPASLATASSALYDAYVAGSTADRAAIDAEFKDSSFYATFKTTVAKDAAYSDAVKATLAAKDVLDTDVATTASTVTIHGVAVVGATDAVKGSAEANTYVTAQGTKALADTTVANAQAADANVAAAKALADAYASQNKAVDTANDAIFKKVTGFNATHTDAKVVDLDASVTALSTVKETFFFADKAVAANTASDFDITSFGSGDSIVLGSSYTFNSGALTTGNGNALEFFLVQNGKNTLVVVETAKYGSSDVAVSAAGAVTAHSAADHAAIITLTGVAATDLTVSNGVISHVA